MRPVPAVTAVAGQGLAGQLLTLRPAPATT